MSSRADLDAALSATADRLSPGSGTTAVGHFTSQLEMIAHSSDAAIRRFVTGDVEIAAPAVFESKRPDGDPVTIEKAREGLLVVFSDGLVFVRGLAFGAMESKALGKGDLSAEKVMTVLNGTEIPGLRKAEVRGGDRRRAGTWQCDRAGVGARRDLRAAREVAPI
jgi:hypothetical protein